MLTVAVCEDDAALRSVLARALRGDGHSVVLGRSGHEAARDFPAAGPDVVVLDIGLPDADGRDVCLALRAGGLAAPVLFLTALDGVHDKIAGFEAGGDDYLTKPFELPSCWRGSGSWPAGSPSRPMPARSLCWTRSNMWPLWRVSPYS